MNKIIALFLLTLLLFQVSAQVQLSGVINQYSKVTFIENNICHNKITVSNITPFNEGQLVVLIQMKGAIINESNSANFGNIQNINSAGFYEINEIVFISGFDVYLKYQNQYNYDINGFVQLVTMPNYEDATVSDILTAEPWNGETGGVFALNISGQLEMAKDIDVSGLGFRGGEAQTASNNNCSWLFPQNDYFYEYGSWRGSAKGEGIADPVLDKNFGKGAQANGGGGGNDHNSGGGGGANIYSGGLGGENNEPSLFGCQGNHPGIGGKAIADFEDRIFLGGGGGAGHDNNEVATNGANGGGVVILVVNNLSLLGTAIYANGNSPSEGTGDGAGGGGGGGSIYLNVKNEVNGQIHLSVAGGNGGNIDNGGGERCHGPGGGGSGGRLITNLILGSSSLSTTLGGGFAGSSINSSSCPNGSNGAESGEDGGIEGIDNDGNNIFANQEFLFPEADFSFTNNMLEVNFSSLLQNANLINWDFGDGNFSSVANPIHTYAQSGTYNVQLIVSNSCGIDTFNQSIFVEMVEANFLVSEEGGCVPLLVNFQNNSIGSVNDYFWTFEAGNPTISTDENPQVFYGSPGIYDVQLEIYSISGNDTVLVENAIEVLNVPLASFDFFSPSQGTINFENNSIGATSFEWDFGDGTTLSNEEMPSHTYDSTGNFVVTLIASNEYCSNTITGTVSILTSLDELDLSKVRIFPNPSTNFITVELQNLGKAQIDFFSMDGNKIKYLSGTFFQSKLLNVSKLPKGVFTILVSQNKRRGFFRWVKIN